MTLTRQLTLILAKEEVSSKKDVKKRKMFYFPSEVFGKRYREGKKVRGRENICVKFLIYIFLFEFLFNKL